MKFNLGTAPAALTQRVRVGNVYPAQGNRPTVAWVVVAVRDNRVTMLGIDAEGAISSGQTYGEHAMSDRPVIGRCEDIEAMSLNIAWFGEARKFKQG